MNGDPQGSDIYPWFYRYDGGHDSAGNPVGNFVPAPSWAVDVAACWVNNIRDMINLQNAIYFTRDFWNNNLAPYRDLNDDSGFTEGIYWGWNEVPGTHVSVNTETYVGGGNIDLTALLTILLTDVPYSLVMVANSRSERRRRHRTVVGHDLCDLLAPRELRCGRPRRISRFDLLLQSGSATKRRMCVLPPFPPYTRVHCCR